MRYFKLKILIIFAILGVVVLGTTAAGDPGFDHPCHPGGTGGPPGPGSPPAVCPTPVPSNGSSDSTSRVGAKGFRVGFRLVNQTAQTITLWLGNPVNYVLNVPSNTTQNFTVDRNVYSYSLLSCGVEQTGYMNLTVQSFYVVEACNPVDLTRITVQNKSRWSLELMLAGPMDYVLFLMPGQSKVLTVAKGDYSASYQGCLQPADSINFTAKANANLELGCPN